MMIGFSIWEIVIVLFVAGFCVALVALIFMALSRRAAAPDERVAQLEEENLLLRKAMAERGEGSAQGGGKK